MLRRFSVLAIAVLVCTCARAATGVRRDAQALALAQQSVQAMLGNTTLADATLKGSVSFVAGGGEETGTFTLELKGNQESKLVLNLSGGTREEIRNTQSGLPQGEWIDADGQSHQMALHNCWTDAGVILPAITLEALLNNPQMAAIYAGQSVPPGGSSPADHLKLYYVVPGPGRPVTESMWATGRP